MRCVEQATRGQEPFVPFVSSPHLCFIKVTVEMRWLSALKVVLSTVLCCLLFCFVTLMNILCVEVRNENTCFTFLPLNTQSKLVSVSAKISSLK